MITRSFTTTFVLSDTSGTPIEGIVIEIRDANDSLIALDTTDADGFTSQRVLVHYRRDGNGRIDLSPYSIIAKFPSRDTVVTYVADAQRVVDIQVVPAILDVVEAKTGAGVTFGEVRPNPFTGQTRLHFDLAQSANVRIEAYDLSGRLLDVLLDGRHGAGTHEVEWKPDGLPGGVYIIRLTVDDITLSRKVILQ
jgi:hypothetical protein